MAIALLAFRLLLQGCFSCGKGVMSSSRQYQASRVDAWCVGTNFIVTAEIVYVNIISL